MGGILPILFVMVYVIQEMRRESEIGIQKIPQVPDSLLDIEREKSRKSPK